MLYFDTAGWTGGSAHEELEHDEWGINVICDVTPSGWITEEESSWLSGMATVISMNTDRPQDRNIVTQVYLAKGWDEVRFMGLPW